MDDPFNELARNLGFENFSSLCLLIRDVFLMLAAMSVLALVAKLAAIMAVGWKYFQTHRRKARSP